MRSRISLERALLLVLVACAFVLSWAALTAVARGAGFGDLSVLLAVVVDGFAIISARSLERLDGRGPRAYSWTLLVGLVAFSVWLNTEHAHLVPVPGLDLTEGQAQLIAGSVPVILAAAFHLTILIQRADERRAKAAAGSAPATPGTEAPESSETRSPAALTADQEAEQIVAEARPALTARPAAPRDGGRTHQQARTWWETHLGPTPKDMARAMGLDPDTAARWAEEFAREEAH